MAKKSKGGVKLPAFLSTHPTTKKRQKNQREWLPKARKRYQRNALQRDTLKPLWGKNAGSGSNNGGTGGRSAGTRSTGHANYVSSPGMKIDAFQLLDGIG